MRYLIFGDEGLIGTELKNQLFYYDGVEKGKPIPDKEYDCIIHLAANCIIRDVILNPELAKENVDATYKIFEYARQNNIRKIVYFSSSRVTHQESNPYISSKVFGESLCKAYYDAYGIDYIIIRPETVWSKGDKHKRVITAWIEAAKANEEIMVFGNKRKILSPIHVSSFVQVFLKILNNFMKGLNEQRIYSISGRPRTAEDIIKTIKEAYNSDSKVFYGSPELTQPQEQTKSDISVDDLELHL
jgi:UDP-glucose 4-epimerase